MEGLFRILVLGCHGGLLAAVEPLLACARVHDNAKRSNHVNGLALRGVPQVLLAVRGTVAVDVLNLKLSLRGLLVCL